MIRRILLFCFGPLQMDNPPPPVPQTVEKPVKRQPIPYDEKHYSTIARYLTEDMPQPVYENRLSRILDSLHIDNNLAAGKHILVSQIADRLTAIPAKDHPRIVETIKAILQPEKEF